MSRIIFTFLLVAVIGLTNSFSQTAEKAEITSSINTSEQGAAYTHGKTHQHPQNFIKTQLVRNESAAHGKIHSHPATVQAETHVNVQDVAVAHGRTHTHPNQAKTAQADGAVSHIHFARIEN